ncbi:MAG TPA: branched-chain amino acid ABC transporter permease [Pyrinomonadaceae bacterium]|nr:branched-chain amino acid ABC transporter permease [Pyrinomonadaceae bacterium]
MPTFVKRILGLVIVVLLLVGANAWMGREGLFGFGLPYYYAEILSLTGISIILAVSLNLITGFTGQFSIGHAGFMAVGAYSSVFMTVYYSDSAEKWLTSLVGATLAQSVVFLGVIIFGALVAALAGLVVGIPSLRLRGDYLAIVTLGFAEIIRIIILNIDRVGGATGFRGRVPPWDGRLIIPQYPNFIWIGGFAVITIVVVYNIVNSDIGRALISIREDELASEAMGINTTRYKVLSFVISSAFAGIAGALFGHFRQFLHTNDFQFIRSIEIIIMIVLGGMGSITGAVLGAIVITILPELLRKLPGDLYGYRLVIYSALLILIMLTRPQGVMGAKEFGLSWLKRAQRRPEGDKPIGEKGVPIAQQGASPALDQPKEIEHR